MDTSATERSYQDKKYEQFMADAQISMKKVRDSMESPVQNSSKLLAFISKE